MDNDSAFIEENQEDIPRDFDEEYDEEFDEEPDEEFDEEVDEELDEEPDEEFDEEPDEEFDEEVDEEFDEEVDEELDEEPDEEFDEELDEESEEEFDEEIVLEFNYLESFTEEDLKKSPIYELLESLRKFSPFDAYLRGLVDVIESTVSRVSTIIDNDVPTIPDDEDREDIKEILEDVRDLIDDLSRTIYIDSDFDDLPEMIDALEELNEEFLFLWKEITSLPEDEEELMALIEDMMKEIPLESYRTETFVTLEEGAEKFIADIINEDEFRKILDEVWEKIRETSNNYDELDLNEEDFTFEEALGDALIVEGVTEWENAVIWMEVCLVEKNPAGLLKGVDMAYEGNRKLILLQYLSNINDEPGE